MATDQLIAPLASLELTPGMQVKFEAINPTTGAAITGVKVTNVAIYGDDVSVAALDSGGTLATSYQPVLLRTQV